MTYPAPGMSTDVGNNRHANYLAYVHAAGPVNQHGAGPATLGGVQHQNVAIARGQMDGAVANDGVGAVMNQFRSLALPGPNAANTGGVGPVPAHPYHDHTVAYQGYSLPVHVGMAPENAYTYSMAGQYPMHNNYAQIPLAYQPVPYTPGRAISAYNDRSSASEVPGLEARRSSYSTTESTPATPFFGSTSDRGGASRVAVLSSSYNTPSPEQVSIPTKGSQPIEEEIISLLKQDPAIPEAVPAVFTPTSHAKSIDQCLENRIHGNRNVYIRGLHPTTDDELLLRYASRFGEVEQSKAIIDTATGACKGFGFAKFVDVRNSEKCIKGFFALGYEVGFARESFNARLKAEGDEHSTNLYLSNLPKYLNEQELNAIFTGYTVASSKILRDSMGNSRGVGFARFNSREECEDIIHKYHGVTLGKENQQIQIRYADTPAQKELKRITAERRQFRTNEYNIGAYGTADVGIHPSIYSQQPWNRRAGGGPHVSYVHSSRGAGAAQGGVGHAVKFCDPSKLQSVTAPSSSDGSLDEGVTVVDSPIVAHGSTQSSPTAKKEKP
ncbi:hypothetical protein GQ53DRAFT_833123 [Thozetella sp. PMI_491]|nr:hypothetical protein GQ53DRAFT_833123 [Thozetella sp. PMI_491]